MKRNTPHALLAALVVTLLALPASAQTAARTESSQRGSITGRVLNEETGQFLRSAVVTVVGTNISTLAESGGVYTLDSVPAGEVRISVSFIGLNPVENSVRVEPGKTTVHDFGLTSKADTVVRLGEFRVVTERDADYKALQEKKSALEIKSVMSSDAFGDVSEGNVGEFLKLMPGVQMDYVDADVRTMSIGGLDPKYSMIMMDGAPIASAGSSNIGTGRTFEFEQLSISSIETVELSKTPTPDVAGSALAGVVNLRSRGAFDRRGRQIRWSGSAGFNSHHLTLAKTAGPDDDKNLKVQPNAALEYSDVVLGGKLGVLAGYSFARSIVEQNGKGFGYVLDADPSNNATEIPRLGGMSLGDAPKVTTRSNTHLRFDYKLTPNFSTWARIDYSTYVALNYYRSADLTFGNAVNGPEPTDPRRAGVAYSRTSQTTTSGSAVLRNALFFRKSGETTTISGGGSFTHGGFRADVQATQSRATNFYKDIPYGFFTGGSTRPLTNLELRWDRSSPDDVAVSVTQLTGNDWKSLASYPPGAAPESVAGGRRGKDQKWTVKADFRQSLRKWRVPMVFKWGSDTGLDVRDVSDTPARLPLEYLGPDGVRNSGDERWQAEPLYRMRNLQGGNLQNIQVPDGFAMAKEYGAHPERFIQPTPAQLLTRRLRTHWDVKEQIDSLYQQTIFQVTEKFDIAPGVRMERTRSAGRGPTDRGDDYAKNLLTGNPNANIPINSLEYIQARYGSDAINSSNYRTWLKYLHATYRWSNDVILRASFNDSITRPDLANLGGGLTINPDALPFPVANIPNPDLKPEHGRNVFVGAEYYFPKGAGFVSVSGARRDISNLIRNTSVLVPPNGSFPNQEGYDLAGHRVNTTINLAKAHLTSAEISYRQNMVFLPGFWRGASLFANYTRLYFDNYENFRRPKQLANGGVSFDYRGVSFRWNVVYVPAYRRFGSRADGWKILEPDRLGQDMQVSYRLPRNMTVFLSGRNVFNRAQVTYVQSEGNRLIAGHSDYGALWIIGVRGQH